MTRTSQSQILPRTTRTVRARWHSNPPEPGQWFCSGSRARRAFLIVVVTPVTGEFQYHLEVESFPLAMLPEGAVVHSFTWDRRR